MNPGGMPDEFLCEFVTTILKALRRPLQPSSLLPNRRRRILRPIFRIAQGFDLLQ